MTKKELEQIAPLKLEIKAIQSELDNLPYTRDSVKGSMPEHPYIQHTIVISGPDESRGELLRKRLDCKCDELQGRIEQMEDWLDGIENSTDRSILRMYYRNGLTLKEIGAELGYSESMISKRLKKIFEKE